MRPCSFLLWLGLTGLGTLAVSDALLAADCAEEADSYSLDPLDRDREDALYHCLSELRQDAIVSTFQLSETDVARGSRMFAYSQCSDTTDVSLMVADAEAQCPCRCDN